jgi:HEAT repeat protein
MPDTASLNRRLESGDPEERREAAVALGRIGRNGVPSLIRAIGDPDWRVRKTAVEALVGLVDAEVIDSLLCTLSRDDNAGARNSAIEALIHIGAKSVESLLRSLETPDPDVRKFIVDILGEIKDPRAVPALIGSLDDADENIQVAAAEALGKIKDRRAVDPLLACLSRSDQGWLDHAAAEALGEIGDEGALGALLAALNRSSLREPVLEALGRIGNVGTLAPLINGLADPLRIVREVSVSALVAIYRKSNPPDRETIVRSVRSGISDAAIDYLEETLGSVSGVLQKALIAALGWAGRERSIGKLISLLHEEEMEEPVFQALRTIDGRKTPLLLSYLADDNAIIRRTVTRVLGDRGQLEAEGALIGLLQDENGHVRSAAAEALGSIKSRAALPGLLDLLGDEYQSVQESAIRALAEISDESVLNPLVRDFTSHDMHLRRNIALLLGKFSSDTSADALAFALKDEEPEVRKAAVHSLGNLSLQYSHRSLMLAVTDDDPEVRMLAAEALGRSGNSAASRTLISLLQDPDLWVRAAAARGLGKTGWQGAADVLGAHLTAASDIFLLAIIEVLGSVISEKNLDPLLKLLDHDDPEVRKTVLTVLPAYSWERVRPALVARLSDRHWSVRKTAVEILKQKKDQSALPLLLGIAEADPDGAVRKAAQEALEN